MATAEEIAREEYEAWCGRGNEVMDSKVEESVDFWRGYNRGIADIKLMLEMIKDRQD